LRNFFMGNNFIWLILIVLILLCLCEEPCRV